MRLSDLELPLIAFNNLRQQKLRSYLTLAGIIIGIVIIVALISIGQSMQRSIEQQFESLGMNTLSLQPGSEDNMMTSATARTIKEEDIRIIQGVQYVEEVIPFYETTATIKMKGEETGVMILGIEPSQIAIMKRVGYIDLVEGRDLFNADKYSMIIYKDFADSAFDSGIKLREKLQVGNEYFRVTGISKPNSFMGFSFSNMIFVTKAAARDLFGAKDPTELMITVTDQSRVKEAKEKIESALIKAHGEKDFFIMSSEDLLQTFGVILSLVQAVLLGIASISIVVGGVGIMNTMLMAVTERTREIGVMKAIGASNSKVLSLIIMESAIIGAIGGLFGIAIGLGSAYLVTIIATAIGISMPFIVNLPMIAGVFIFSGLIGAIAGYIPARRAANLDPVEALRYE